MFFRVNVKRVKKKINGATDNGSLRRSDSCHCHAIVQHQHHTRHSSPSYSFAFYLLAAGTASTSVYAWRLCALTGWPVPPMISSMAGIIDFIGPSSEDGKTLPLLLLRVIHEHHLTLLLDIEGRFSTDTGCCAQRLYALTCGRV